MDIVRKYLVTGRFAYSQMLFLIRTAAGLGVLLAVLAPGGRSLAQDSDKKPPEDPKEKSSSPEARSPRSAPRLPSFALVGGTVYPVAGTIDDGPIHDGVVVVENGKITLVGKRSDVEIPAGLEKVSIEGKSVIPGIVAITSGLLLEGGRGDAPATQDIADEVDPLHASIPILLREGITSLGLAPEAGSGTGGLGMALKLKARRLVTGQSSKPAADVADLDLDDVKRIHVLKSRAFLTLELGKVGNRLGARASTNVDRLNQYYALRRTFTKAKSYEKAWKTYREAVVKYNEALRKWKEAKKKSDEKDKKDDKAKPSEKAKDEKPKSSDDAKKDPKKRRGFSPESVSEEEEEKKEEKKPPKPSDTPAKPPAKPPAKKESKPPTPPKRPGVDESSEVILRAMSGELPVWVVAHGRDDVGYAIRLKEDFGLKLTVLGGTEAYRRGEELHEAEIPVVVWPVLHRDIDVRLRNHRESNPASLAAAGVSVSIGSLDGDVLVSRLLRWQAAVAVRGGLSKEAALRAITLEAAKRLGIAERVGSIEKGKDADLVVIDGDPLSATARVHRVFVDGVTVEFPEREPEGE